MYSPWWARQRHSPWVRMTMIYLHTNLLGGLSDFDYTSLSMQSLGIAPVRQNCLHVTILTQATYGASRAFGLLNTVNIKTCKGKWKESLIPIWPSALSPIVPEPMASVTILWKHAESTHGWLQTMWEATHCFQRTYIPVEYKDFGVRLI